MTSLVQVWPYMADAHFAMHTVANPNLATWKVQCCVFIQTHNQDLCIAGCSTQMFAAATLTSPAFAIAAIRNHSYANLTCTLRFC
jgi:hypothetical protein